MTRLRPTRHLWALLLITFLVTVPSVANGFAMDDIPIARSTTPENEPDPVIRGWRSPLYYFGQRYWEGTSNDSVLYRPVTIWSLAWTYNGVSTLLPPEWEAAPHHLLNVLLHLFAVYLVWWMLGDLRCGMGALIGAALFGLHALHSEVIAGIVGRAELGSFVFGLWGTLVFARGRVLAASLLLFLAFCSKESGLAWAPFLPCYLLARRWRRAGGAAPEEPGGFPLAGLLLAVGPGLVLFFVLRALAIDGMNGAATFSYEQNPLAHLDPAGRWLNGIKLWGYGAWKCVAPFWLYCLYGPGVFDVVESPADPWFLVAALGLGAWLVAGLVWARRLPLLFLSVATFFGFSFLTSNLPLTIGTMFGERLYYMPSLGVCLLPVLLWERLPPATGRFGGRRVLLAVLGVWLVASAGVLFLRNGAWKDSPTLFLGDAERLPTSADLQAKAAYMHWVERKDPDTALVYFQRCLDRDPGFANCWGSMARIHAQRGEPERALELFRKSLATKYIGASGVEDRTITDYLMLLLKLRQLKEAVDEARRFLQRKPGVGFALATALVYAEELPGGVQIAPAERMAMLDAAMAVPKPDPIAILLHGMALYERLAGVRSTPQQIAQELGLGLQQANLKLLGPKVPVRARIYYGDILKSLGQRAQALAVFRSLLAENLLTGATKQQIEAQVRELSR